MRTLIVIPTHNEADNIVEVLERVRSAVPDVDVMVVDDASSDDTRRLVKQLQSDWPALRLVERDSKSGLGDAYVHAFDLALDAGYELIAQMDADLSHPPESLPLLLSVAERGIDVVIGSRYVPGGRVTGWPRRRLWLSRWGNRYVAVMLGLAINDATAGFRVYRAATLRGIDLDRIRADGYGFQIEMTYHAVEQHRSIVEVPIEFRDRVAGNSKMSASIVLEAFRLVTVWGLADLLTMRRRRRAYS